MPIFLAFVAVSLVGNVIHVFLGSRIEDHLPKNAIKLKKINLKEECFQFNPSTKKYEKKSFNIIK